MNLEDTNEDAKVDKKVYELDEWKDDVVDESDIDDGNCVVVGGSAVVDDGSGVMTSESAIIDNSDEDGVSTGPTIQIKGFASRVDSMNLETIEGEEEGQRASREVDLPNEQMASEIEERLAKVEEARRRKRQERRAGR